MDTTFMSISTKMNRPDITIVCIKYI